jgi:hypothetical protein
VTTRRCGRSIGSDPFGGESSVVDLT